MHDRRCVRVRGSCLIQGRDLEPCESGCLASGRALTGPDSTRRWYELRLFASAHVEGGDCGPDCMSQWIAHTPERCRDRRVGLDAIAASLGFPPDEGY